QARAEHARPSTCRSIHEPHERMLVHAQSLLDISLGERARCDMTPLSVFTEALHGRIRQAKAEWLTHVAHGSALRYIATSARLGQARRRMPWRRLPGRQGPGNAGRVRLSEPRAPPRPGLRR